MLDHDLQVLETERAARRERRRILRRIVGHVALVWSAFVLSGVDLILPNGSILATLLLWMVVLPLWLGLLAYFIVWVVQNME